MKLRRCGSLGSLALLVAVGLSACDSGVLLDAPDPDLTRIPDGPEILFTDGTVITVHPMSRVDEAILIRGNRIVATGKTTALRKRAGPDAVEIDLAGRTVMPGFVDPHNHIFNQVFLQGDPQWGSTYDEAQQILLGAGWTTIANPGIWPDAMAAFLPFAQSDDLRIRTSVYLGYNDFCGGGWPEAWFGAYPPITDPEAKFRIPGLKLFTDGGACNTPSYSFLRTGGDLYMESEEIASVIRLAESLGYQLVAHALGDRAIGETLDAFEEVKGKRPSRSRHRMDHLRWVPPEQWRRFGKLGITPVFFAQPSTCWMNSPLGWFNGLYAPHNEPLRPWYDPIKAVMETNPQIRVTAKSDAPTFRLPALENLWSLVTREVIASPAEAPPGTAVGDWCEAPDFLAETGLDVEDAIQMLTINAAYALGMDEVIGSLRKGKLADLVVLSDNPLDVGSDDLRHIEVLMTMVGGQVEHCRVGEEALCPAD